MNVLRQLIIFIWICGWIMQVFAAVNINETNCDFNPMKINRGNCKIVTKYGSMKYLSVEFNIIKALDEIWLRLILLRKERDRYLNLLDAGDLNLCEFGSKKTNNSLFNRLLFFAAKSVRIKCPLQGKKSYPRIPLLLHYTQGLLPIGDYVFNALVNHKQEYFLVLNISFALSPFVS